MTLEFLGLIGFEKTLQKGAFLLNAFSTLEELSNRKVIIFGTGINSFFAKKLLNDKNIDVDYYIDNNVKLQGREIDGKPIVSPYDYFKKQNGHIIIAVDGKNINSVRLQLKLYHIDDYSIFFTERMHDFDTENEEELADVLIDTINKISLEGKSIKEVAPLKTNISGEDQSKIGILNYLLYSTTWSHHVYKWLYHELKSFKEDVEVLDIGPGYGLLSALIARVMDSCHINWLCFSKHEGTDFDAIMHHGAGKYLNSKLNIIYGIVESNEIVFHQQYDIIIMTEVFEHFVANPVPTMKKIASALKDNGRLYFTTPNWGHLNLYDTWEKMKSFEEFSSIDEYYDMYIGHMYQYSKDELINIFEQSGLSVVKYELSDGNNHNCILIKK